MVNGLDIFRTFFRDYTDKYILIGGAACDELLAGSGLTFRATKDLDIILIVEALDPEFVKHFWKFVKAGGYENRQKSTGERKYYRFMKPVNDEYPVQLELFTRNPDFLDLPGKTRLTQIPVEEDLSSLSAILMQDDYYFFTLDHSEIVDHLHRATSETLICLKAKAFFNLKARKEQGERIDRKHIKKHKNDVIRLAALLVGNEALPLPVSIRNDMLSFIKELETEPPDMAAIGANMGVPGLKLDKIVEQIKTTFRL